MEKKSMVLGAGVGLAGLLAGGILASSLSASAEGTSGSTTATYAMPAQAGNGAAHGNGNTDPSKPMRNDEKLLTGSTKDKVTVAVKAKYPNATFQRVETDSDGVYEAHIVDNGAPMIVQVGSDFTITGTQTGGPGGPGGAAPPAV